MTTMELQRGPPPPRHPRVPPGPLDPAQSALGSGSGQGRCSGNLCAADLGVTRPPQGGPGPYHLGPVGQQQALVIHHEQADVAVCAVGEGGAQVTGDEVALVLGGEAQALEGVPAKQPCGRLVLGRHRPEPQPVLGVGVQEPSR